MFRINYCPCVLSPGKGVVRADEKLRDKNKRKVMFLYKEVKVFDKLDRG
jgi:hypothetical protein